MRCFIAIDLPDSIKEEIKELQRNIKEKGIKNIKAENLHITLKFLGNLNEREVKRIKNELHLLNPKEKFKIHLENPGVFTRQNIIRIIWLGASKKDDILSIKNELDARLAKHGFGEDKKYTPHVTIARVNTGNNEKVKNRIMQLKDFKTSEFFIDAIKLKQSTLTPEGSLYKDLEIIKIHRRGSTAPP